MKQWFDRKLQRLLLEELASYPATTFKTKDLLFKNDAITIKKDLHYLAKKFCLQLDFSKTDDEDKSLLIDEWLSIIWVNLIYLSGHNLVQVVGEPPISECEDFKITSQGVDFLANDGGINTLLNHHV